MAYKKTYRRPYRKNYRRNGRYNNRNTRWNNYSRAYNQLWKDVGMLKGLVNTEFKTLDINVSIPSLTTTGAVLLHSGLTKGDNVNERDGRMVRWKSIQIAGSVTRNAASTVQNRIHLALVIDTQPNGSGPVYTEIYDTATPDSFRNLDGRKRFVILKTWDMVLDADRPEKFFKLYKKLDMKTVYNSGDSGTISDIESNALLVLAISDAATNTPSFTYKSRARFIDN